MTAARPSWDVFCRVVDNYGDIGIAWRLAKQLAADGSRAVRLVVDGVDAFARIEPRIERTADRSSIDTVDIVAWSVAERVSDDIADVVVELLGCGLPASCIDAMVRRAERGTRSVWIDFEHLSAEDWVADFHALPSPHPVLPLVKHFFYPGFGPRTGGLLIEPDHERRRADFLADPAAIAALWSRVRLDVPDDGEARLLLFAYADAPVAPLLQALAADPHRRWSVLVPGEARSATGGPVPVTTFPFVDQDDFDRLLWACDAAFVRGEDSFIRAQLAGRPFVWQIYTQPDAIHLTKLAAFEVLHEADLATSAGAAQQAMCRAWNDRPATTLDAATAWLAELPALQAHAERWRQRLLAGPVGVERLVDFAAACAPASGGPGHLLD